MLPWQGASLRIPIGRAPRQVRLTRDNAFLRDQLKKHYSVDDIVGSSEGMQRVFWLVSPVAPTDASVFITGAPGTGKEPIARASLHRR